MNLSKPPASRSGDDPPALYNKATPLNWNGWGQTPERFGL